MIYLIFNLAFIHDDHLRVKVVYICARHIDDHGLSSLEFIFLVALPSFSLMDLAEFALFFQYWEQLFDED